MTDVIEIKKLFSVEECQMKKYEKIITINEPVMIKERQELIFKCSNLLLNFMFENNQKFDYFMIRLKDSENSPFSKDLVLQWTEE